MNIAVFYGLGKHATEVPPQNIPTVLEVSFSATGSVAGNKVMNTDHYSPF